MQPFKKKKKFDVHLTIQCLPSDVYKDSLFLVVYFDDNITGDHDTVAIDALKKL